MISSANFHSHSPQAPLRCVSPDQFADAHNRFLTLGIHPWQSAEATADTIALVDRLAADKRVVAIGEIGLDALRGAPIPNQIALLEAQIDIAQRHDLPIVLHIVRCYDRLLNLLSRRRISVPVAIHGFRGKPQLASELCRRGLYLSLGQRFNAQAAAVIPYSHLLIETDDAPIDQLTTVATAVATARNTTADAILTLAQTNLNRFLLGK
jgi:TatD DNase family protein